MTLATGLRIDMGIGVPLPNRMTRSGRVLPAPSQRANSERMDGTSTGWLMGV